MTQKQNCFSSQSLREIVDILGPMKSEKESLSRYQHLSPIEHINRAATDGNLEEFKVALERLGLERTAINTMAGLVATSQNQQAAQDSQIQVVVAADPISADDKTAIDKMTLHRYDLLDETEHISIAAFNGDLEQLKLGLARIDHRKLLFSSIIRVAAIGGHKDCAEYLMGVAAEQKAKEVAKREAEEKNPPRHHLKVCSSCGPVSTKFSNCPRCWGPVRLRQP